MQNIKLAGKFPIYTVYSTTTISLEGYILPGCGSLVNALLHRGSGEIEKGEISAQTLKILCDYPYKLFLHGVKWNSWEGLDKVTLDIYVAVQRPFAETLPPFVSWEA